MERVRGSWKTKRQRSEEENVRGSVEEDSN
jgi:hypothetical protein